MGGHGSGRKADPTKQFIPERQAVVDTGRDTFELPSRGGDHSAGRVKTPTTDTSIANKKYVDDTAGGSVPASNVTPGGFGGSANYSFPTTLTISGSILNILPTAGVSTIRSNNSNTRMDYSTNRSTGTQTAHRFIVDGTTTAMDILDSKNIVMFGNLSGQAISGASFQEVGASGAGVVFTRADGTMTGGHTAGGGGGTPGGSDTQVQFNDGGDFGGSGAFTFAKGTGDVLISGSLTVGTVDGDQVLVHKGTTALPGLAFVQDPDTGMRGTGTNFLFFV